MVNADKPNDTLAAAYEIKYDYPRCNALIAIAEELIEAGQTDEARKVLNDALNAAHQIKEDLLRSDAFATVAKELARWQRYRQARLTANKCSRSEDKLAAYAAILSEYAKEKIPTLRKQLGAEEAESENDEEKITIGPKR